MASKIRIRQTKDLATVQLLDSQTFDPKYDYPVNTEGCVWWVAWDGDEPVAFAGLKKLIDSDRLAYLCRVGVLESHRGQGLQRRLIRARVNWCKSQKDIDGVITYTIASNTHSSNNLIKEGFTLYRPEYQWEGPAALYWTNDF